MPDPPAIHDAFAEALCTHDERRLLDCFHPNAVLVTPVGLVEGHEEIEWYFGQFFSTVPDLKTRVTTMLVQGDTLAVEWVTSGIQSGTMLLPDGTEIPGTGSPICWTGCAVWTVEDGKFLTGRIYYDQLNVYISRGCRLVQIKPESAAAPDHAAAPGREAGPGSAAGSRPNAVRRFLRRLAGL